MTGFAQGLNTGFDSSVETAISRANRRLAAMPLNLSAQGNTATPAVVNTWNVEINGEVIDKDGWVHTGDLARVDEDGYYYITGRKKNLIILASGENVSPEELEKKLALCPTITECIVKEKSQKICAVIYCPEDKQEEVRAFVTEVNRSLPLYKRISAVEFTAEPLPRNALGKLLRK